MEGLVRQLKHWQAREWFFRLAWGVARLAAFVVVAVTLACLTDWIIDRYTDTPFWLRVTLSVCQVLLFVGTTWYFLFHLRVPTLDTLAARAEGRVPEFGHRLVTALQLNRPAAKTEGMSKQLIEAVTAEAGALSARYDLKSFAEKYRFTNAAYLLFPLVILTAGFVALRYPLVRTLLARQCLQDVDIPRSVALVDETIPLWPSGDEVTIRYKVSGRYDAEAVGSVRVFPDGQPAESYPLKFAEQLPDDAAYFEARVPASSVAFRFRARLQDGRTRGDESRVRFEPRPVVDGVAAWLVLPSFVGLNPKGERYERSQPQAEVIALRGSAVDIGAGFSKPIASATVVVLTTGEKGEERVALRVPMQLSLTTRDMKDGTTRDVSTGLTQIEIKPEFTGYRIECADANGFKNLFPPRRGISHAPDEPPLVALLPEIIKDPRTAGPLEEFEVNGMPITQTGIILVGYSARSPIGLRAAQIVYRVNEGPWSFLPLKITEANFDVVGKWLPELGLFERSDKFSVVEFYPVPAINPNEFPSGLDGGGRYIFQVTGLNKSLPDGGSAKLDVGDRVEFFVEVFDRDPTPDRPAGRSETRIKMVVTQAQLEDWTRQRLQTADRLRMIEERQRGVFTPRN